MKRSLANHISKGNLKDSISKIGEDVNDEYSFLGGWLVIFICSLIIKIIYSAYNALTGAWIYVAVSENAVLIVFLESINILLAATILIIIRFRSYKVLYAIRVLYIACTLFSVVALSQYNIIFNDNTHTLTYGNVAWIIYLFKSRRVRHYYYKLEEVKTNSELEYEKPSIVEKNNVTSPSETRFQANTSVEKLTLPAENLTPVSSEKPVKKVPLCALCGMPIDVETLVCTGCGKKYVRRKKAPPAIDSKTIIGTIIGADFSNLKSIDSLVIQTVMTAHTSKGKEQTPLTETLGPSLLYDNKFSLCDIVLFTTFILRALMIGSTKNRVQAKEYSEEYISKIMLCLSPFFDIEKEVINKMAINRFSTYDEVFMNSHGDFDKKILNVIEEFNNAIKKDFGQNTYNPIKSDDPVIVGGLNFIQCDFEIMSLYKYILTSFKTLLQQIQNEIK